MGEIGSSSEKENMGTPEKKKSNENGLTWLSYACGNITPVWRRHDDDLIYVRRPGEEFIIARKKKTTKKRRRSYEYGCGKLTASWKKKKKFRDVTMRMVFLSKHLLNAEATTSEFSIFFSERTKRALQLNC